MLDNWNVGRKLVAVFGVIAAITIFASVASTLSLMQIAGMGENFATTLSPLRTASQGVRLNLTMAHLKVEEIAGGDEAGTFEDVVAFLEAVRENITMLKALAEDDDAGGHLNVIAAVNEMMAMAEGFKQAAQLRYILLSQDRGVGSDADEQFDQLYETLLEQISQVSDNHLNDAVAQASFGLARQQLSPGHLLVVEILCGDFGEDIKEAYEAFESAGSLFSAEVERLQLSGTASAEISNNIGAFNQLARQRYDNTMARIAAVT